MHRLTLSCHLTQVKQSFLHSSLLFGKMTEMTEKRSRVLTGWLVGSQVFEMDAFDDLHRETSCCGVVHQAHEDLWCGRLTD